jgi:hypothetical protein
MIFHIFGNGSVAERKAADAGAADRGSVMNLVKVQNKDGKDIFVNTEHIDFMEDKGHGIWRVVCHGQGLDLYYDWIKEILRFSPARNDRSQTEGAFKAAAGSALRANG